MEDIDAGNGSGSSNIQPEFGVVAIDAIPAGSWVLRWAGEYIVLDDFECRGLPEFQIDLQNAMVPVHAAVTPPQQAQCSAAAINHIEGDASTHWRALPGAVIDSRRRGNAARFIRRSENPNIGCAEIDLPTGPTGVFLFAIRNIAKGEELTMLA